MLCKKIDVLSCCDVSSISFRFPFFFLCESYVRQHQPPLHTTVDDVRYHDSRVVHEAGRGGTIMRVIEIDLHSTDKDDDDDDYDNDVRVPGKQLV